MPRPEKRSDVVESRSEVALEYVLAGAFVLLLGVLLYRYRGQAMLSEWAIVRVMCSLAIVMMICGGLSILYGFSRAWKTREVPMFEIVCSYCQVKNHLTAAPTADFTCSACKRLIPIQDAEVMPVFQVRCGFCNELNYYNAKTEVLICEKCDREIPIAQEEGKPQKHLPRGFVVQDDPNLYDLVLLDAGAKTEELIPVLQHMLALTRPQVKQMIGELPATLLTGITRKKAELLQAQLVMHEAKADFHPVSGQVS
jgi:hypothetical protein